MIGENALTSSGISHSASTQLSRFALTRRVPAPDVGQGVRVEDATPAEQEVVAPASGAATPTA
jgi:hypothetical protein